MNNQKEASVKIRSQSDGTKLKPFILFKGTKRESKALNDEFKTRCVVAFSSNGWMNTELTLEYTEKILGSFSFGKKI